MTHEEHDSQAEQNIKRDVAECGWSVCLFEADSATPAFGYTIGLWQNFSHPEIICFGLPVNDLHIMLNKAGELVRSGDTPTLAVDNHEILNKLPVQFREVDKSNIADYFGYGQWFYQYELFPAVQLIWPDKIGIFPWQEGFDKKYEFDQPLLEHQLDFKFFEPRNAATFLAECVIKNSKPILWVWHDSDDGTWSFANKAGDTMLLVGLDEVVNRDPTVNELFNMPVDRIATRKYVGDKWKRKQAYPF